MKELAEEQVEQAKARAEGMELREQIEHDVASPEREEKRVEGMIAPIRPRTLGEMVTEIEAAFAADGKIDGEKKKDVDGMAAIKEAAEASAIRENLKADPGNRRH